jgi:hypothetical protein
MPLVVVLPTGTAPGPDDCGDWTSAEEMGACCDINGLTPEQIAAGIASASFILNARSLGMYEGTCTTTARVCVVCTACPGECECGPYPTIDLTPYEPAIGVESVYFNGVLVDPDTYRIDGWRHLVRVADAEGDNPGWEDGRADVPFDHPEAGLVIRWTFGYPIPAAGRVAATTIACEFAKLCSGADCSIPATATTVSREGFVIDLDLGQNGWVDQLPAVRAWLSAVNPHGFSHPARVYSPDAHDLIQQTWP